MKFRTFFILVLLFALFQPYVYMQQRKGVPGTDTLQGKWETVHNPLEASTLTLEFKPNKKFSYILSSTWQGTYKLEGTKLISSLYLPIYKKYKTDTTTVLIFSDTLIQIGKEKDKEITTKMIRKSNGINTGAGLLGTWILENPDGKYSTISYSPTGAFEMKNILQSFNGTYIAKNDTLTVFSQGQVMLRNKFIIDKGNFRIYSPTQSGPITLKRAEK